MARYTKSEAMEWARDGLRGQWTTLMTPFTPDDEIDESALRSNIKHVRSLGTSGAGFTWGMGEFWSLTHDERTRVYDVAAEASAGEWPIAAHVTHTSAKEAVALSDHARAVGFDLLIIAAPYFVTKTEAQVVEFVKLVADGSPLAVMFYNSPQFGIVLGVEGLEKVCAIPNVVGVKEASFDQELSIAAHQRLGQGSIISTPDEWIFFKGRELGFQQRVMFANTSDWRFDTPDESHYVRFIKRATAGDIDDSYYDTHIRPIKQVSDKWWQYTVKKFGGALPASMCKYWGELMGLKHGHVRPPLSDLSPAEKSELKGDLEAVRRQLVAV